MFAEIEEGNDFAADMEFDKGREDKTSFANENVMSKSNLRQPKSFNFGFSDEEEDDDIALNTFKDVEDIQITL